MNFLKKNWKALIALVLVLAAAGEFYFVYRPAQQEYESRQNELNTMITALQHTIADNLRYVDVQDKLEPANKAIDESRLQLYKKFPTELREEDQIMYVVYLEDTFGTEIQFEFGQPVQIVPLSDGSSLNAVVLTVNYQTNYTGFKDMINYLATDSRITSIYNATMQYDDSNDIAVGSLTLLCYLLDSELVEYQVSDITTPSTGKPNIFD